MARSVDKYVYVPVNKTKQVTEIYESKFNEELVQKWLQFTEVNTKTQLAYTKALKQLFKYFMKNKIVNPTREDILNWKSSLIARLKPTSVQLYIVATKLFFRFLAQEDIYQNIADKIKSPRLDPEHKKDALTIKQCKAILSAIDTSTEIGLRDRAIIALMMTAGLRTIEVVRANIEDIHNFGDNIYLSIQGKGHDEKASMILIASQVYKFIKEYLDTRKNKSGKEPLFTSTSRRNFNSRLETQTISKLIKSVMREVGIDDSRHTAHSLRHTAATQALLNGVPLTQVQQILRHSNINTTLIYSHHLERLKNKGEQTVADAIFD